MICYTSIKTLEKVNKVAFHNEISAFNFPDLFNIICDSLSKDKHGIIRMYN